MNKAIILDRDGVINRERGGYTWKQEDFVLTPGIIPFLQAARDKGYIFIVVTNQGGIARGMFTAAEVEQVHEYMRSLLRQGGIELQEIYYCPHSNRLERCLCRKPGSLMLEKAIARFRIDVGHSFFIGDHERDQQAGEAAGIPFVRIEPNEDLMHYVDIL